VTFVDAAAASPLLRLVRSDSEADIDEIINKILELIPANTGTIDQRTDRPAPFAGKQPMPGRPPVRPRMGGPDRASALLTLIYLRDELK